MSRADSSTSLVVPASGETMAAGRWPRGGGGGGERERERGDDNGDNEPVNGAQWDLHRIFRRLLLPAFGAPTIVTCTPLRSLSPLRPSFKWEVTCFKSCSTRPLTMEKNCNNTVSQISCRGWSEGMKWMYYGRWCATAVPPLAVP